MTATGQDFRTMGQLVADLQVSYARIDRAVRKHGIEPAFSLNGCRHFSEEAVERIRRAVKGDGGDRDTGGEPQ